MTTVRRVAEIRNSTMSAGVGLAVACSGVEAVRAEANRLTASVPGLRHG